MIRSIRLAAIALAIGFAGVAAAHAGEQFVDRKKVANFGYDVVAYHTTLSAVKGAASFAATHNGATFWFASAANRDLFLANPASYAPAYDGHCAFALSNTKKLTVDPTAFTIVDRATGKPAEKATYTPGNGTLFMNYSADVNAKFRADAGRLIQRANVAWKDCLEKLPAAKPEKGLSDLLPGSRPGFCPKVG